MISFSSLVDRLIILGDERFIIDISKRESFYSPEREQKLHRDFNSKIPISLSNPKKRGHSESANQHEDGINKIMNNQRSPPIQRRGSSPPNNHFAKDRAEMPPNEEIVTRGRGPNNLNSLNEYDDNSENDVGEDIKRFYTKQFVKGFRSFPSSNLSLEDTSLVKLRKINVSQDRYVRGLKNN